MLEQLDGVVLAVRDAEAAAGTYEKLFGAAVLGSERSDVLGAEVTRLHAGTSVIRLAAPTGPGPAADALERWGEGLFGVVFRAPKLDELVEHIRGEGLSVTEDGDLRLLDPARTHGLATMLVPSTDLQRQGAVSFVYEVTHLVSDWRSVSDLWTRLFKLDGAKFSPISSDQYGYDGMLTLFDPPDRLDRIEVVYPHDTAKAMGRFFVKRGEGPYMCFMETDDISALRARLTEAGARFAPEKEPEEPNSLFVHPSSTHGMLIGVSPRNLAWVWSGRPELARAQT